jgi:hypothetical protein
VIHLSKLRSYLGAKQTELAMANIPDGLGTIRK